MLRGLAKQAPDGSATTETFGDLVFCALIVLLLFVLALAVEVSQRVRAVLEPAPQLTADSVVTLTPEELLELSSQLQKQKDMVATLQEELQSQQQDFNRKSAALAGEQRFTGAREPANLTLAFDYIQLKYYFCASKDLDHATTKQSGESVIEHAVRSRRELAQIARKCRRQRGYTVEEAGGIYRAFSQYREIIPRAVGYDVETSQIGITYSVRVSELIAGDVDGGGDVSTLLVEAALHAVHQQVGVASETAYPRAEVVIDDSRKAVSLGGVDMTSRELRDILLSFGGRGAMLDLVGIDGPPPEWLSEGALTPAGYIGKMPKAP